MNKGGSDDPMTSDSSIARQIKVALEFNKDIK
jgi:hypothetical protein